MLAGLIDRFDAQWVFAGHARPLRARSRRRLLHAGWRAVYADSANVIVVRPTATPAMSAYAQQHAIDLRRTKPGDLAAAPTLRRQQEGTSRRSLPRWDRATRHRSNAAREKLRARCRRPFRQKQRRLSGC